MGTSDLGPKHLKASVEPDRREGGPDARGFSAGGVFVIGKWSDRCATHGVRPDQRDLEERETDLALPRDHAHVCLGGPVPIVWSDPINMIQVGKDWSEIKKFQERLFALELVSDPGSAEITKVEERFTLIDELSV